MKDPFFVQGALKVSNSACVLCLRQRNITKSSITFDSFLSQTKFDTDKAKSVISNQPFIKAFLDNAPLEFLNGWEILLGQNEVVNYLKSTPAKLKTMAFAGEFKLPGGIVDKDERIEDAAKRELFEEFLDPAELGIMPHEVKLRAFSLKQTRPIRSRSSLMHNFVCLEDENQWLKDLDISLVNQKLKEKRERFWDYVQDGSYWELTKSEKEKISPEVNNIRWMPLSDAILCCLTSFLPGFYVNNWQKREFDFLSETNLKKKTKKRDPMMITATTIVEVEHFADAAHVKRFCKGIDMSKLRTENQWLFEGMENDEVVEATRAYFKSANFAPSTLFNDNLREQRKLKAKL